MPAPDSRSGSPDPSTATGLTNSVVLVRIDMTRALGDSFLQLASLDYLQARCAKEGTVDLLSQRAAGDWASGRATGLNEISVWSIRVGIKARAAMDVYANPLRR